MNNRWLYLHGWDDYGSNMNTIINAGEAYDIAFGSSITGVDSFARTEFCWHKWLQQLQTLKPLFQKSYGQPWRLTVKFTVFLHIKTRSNSILGMGQDQDW